MKAYEAIVKGENLPDAEVPESFKVLIKEMQALCLNVELKGVGKDLFEAQEHRAESKDQQILDTLTADTQKAEKEEESAIDDIAAGLDELMGDLNIASDVNDLIGEGEEL